MSEGEGDFAVVLSSALIEEITQEYFSKVMFKQKVKIVDLKPASDGYMFSLAFVKEVKPVVEPVGFMQERVDAYLTETQPTVVRASNGKFAKKEKV